MRKRFSLTYPGCRADPDGIGNPPRFRAAAEHDDTRGVLAARQFLAQVNRRIPRQVAIEEDDVRMPADDQGRCWRLPVNRHGHLYVLLGFEAGR